MSSISNRGKRETTLTAEEYADAQHVARRGGHFAPRDASLIARALLHADARIVELQQQYAARTRDFMASVDRNEEKDRRIAQLEDAGGTFLRAYLDASVNDEEGLLAALDAREWTAMWVSVDDRAQAFGRVLAVYCPADDSESHSDFTDSGGDPRARLYP